MESSPNCKAPAYPRMRPRATLSTVHSRHLRCCPCICTALRVSASGLHSERLFAASWSQRSPRPSTPLRRPNALGASKGLRHPGARTSAGHGTLALAPVAPSSKRGQSPGPPPSTGLGGFCPSFGTLLGPGSLPCSSCGAQYIRRPMSAQPSGHCTHTRKWGGGWCGQHMALERVDRAPPLSCPARPHSGFFPCGPSFPPSDSSPLLRLGGHDSMSLRDGRVLRLLSHHSAQFRTAAAFRPGSSGLRTLLGPSGRDTQCGRCWQSYYCPSMGSTWKGGQN